MSQDATGDDPRDMEKHPKGRRKRTAYVSFSFFAHHTYKLLLGIYMIANGETSSKFNSAKDKMILEDAYNNNPKPDKQARLDIVNRVSLNEKEVQVRQFIKQFCSTK